MHLKYAHMYASMNTTFILAQMYLRQLYFCVHFSSLFVLTHKYVSTEFLINEYPMNQAIMRHRREMCNFKYGTGNVFWASV